ncbi:chemotaxis protein CheW, partial [Oscillospiraceae bacterium OttesenSCG-928-G22]|nr:chemotaxis protein CheW [Oscillospiraceae bacterium OttesenSCG-928-G22]
NDIYGLEIRTVTEIIGVQAITDMPQIPHYIKGIINLRGKIIPVVDVRLRFGKEPVEYDDRTCIIVLERNALVAGIIVDTVLEVQNIPDDNISEPPTGRGGITNQYVSGIARTEAGVRLLLDCDRLLGEEIVMNFGDE